MSHRIRDFPGGIHPPQRKSISTLSPISEIDLPKRLIIPLQQHIGAPAKALVKVGDHVLKGQKIANAHGFVSTPIHASSSGTVIEIGPRTVQHPSQIDGTCVVIETDGKDQWIDHQGVENPLTATLDDLREHIRDAGITGMGGAGFPTIVKLSPPPKTVIDTLVINAVECEPYISADDMLMRERADEIILGIQIIARLVNPKTILMGIEDNKPEAISAMSEAARKINNGPEITVVTVPTKYPSGSEKQLIQILTGREVPSGSIPAEVGVVCQNTGTAYAVYQAVVKGEPLIQRVTTLTGGAIKNPGNVWARIGTSVAHLLQHAGVDGSQLSRLIMGGPMMGFTLHSTEIPLIKSTNCLIASTEEELPLQNPEQACIRCGTCTQACPMQLLPQQLFWYSRSKELEKVQQYNLSDCIECGACSYVCPSNIPLVQYFRYAKGEIKKQESESVKSDQAKQRFEAREDRLAKEAAAKEAKRKARAEKSAKAKAAKAKKAAEEAAQGTASDAEPANKSDDALKILKTAMAKSTKLWKDAEKALAVAESTAGDEQKEQLEAHRAKVERLKEKAEKAQNAFKAFKEKSSSPITVTPPITNTEKTKDTETSEKQT